MTYQQKDLGYPRKPIDGVMEITMPDGSVWAVPLQAIVDSRDEFYAEEQEDTAAFPDRDLRYTINDWAGNNMNWEDVSAYAVRVKREVACDFDEGWSNGEKRIVLEAR